MIHHDRIPTNISGHTVYETAPNPDKPILSVIVLSQNDINRIEEVMDSLIRQEVHQSFEIILVNSGNDGTADFVKDRYPEVLVIHLPEPALPGEARNAGLKVARGDYITFVGSHVVLLPDSLQNRIDAHEQGWAMVTGTMVNGTPTLSGWASYFLDHWIALPGCGSTVLSLPPARCSYKRESLLAIGGFPEWRRAGEDTVVNNKLFDLGHKAYRSTKIEEIHKSPCANPFALIRHHYLRGRGYGRILLDHEGPSKVMKGRRKVRWLALNYPARRAYLITKTVIGWTSPDRWYLFLSFPLVLAGIVSAAVGAILFVLCPEGD